MLPSPLRSTSADGTSLFTGRSVAHPVVRSSSIPPMTPSTSRPLTKLRCLLVVTSRGTDTTPLQTAIAQLRRVSPCASTAVMHVCKAPPKAERTEWHCVPMGRGRQCTKTAPTAVAKGCDVVLPDTGQECHGLLRTLVVGYRWFGGGGHGFDRLVNIPATMLTRSIARRNRLLQIVSSLRRVDSYYDATGVGFAIRENATYELWKGARLTPAQPQPIGAWIDRWVNHSRVCRVFHSQGAFSVPSRLILQRSRHFYEMLLHQVERCAQCEACHYLERLWHAIFMSSHNGFLPAACS